MFHAYKVIYSIQENNISKPFKRTYCFSAQGKRQAMKIANDILADYIIDMKFYTGSVEKITEIK